MSAVLPDALADALGRVIADQKKEYDKLHEIERAESRAIIAELRAQNTTLAAQNAALVAKNDAIAARLEKQVEAKLELITSRLSEIKDGKDGAPGLDGKDGAPGLDGKDGAPGRDGEKGEPGVDGEEGAPGASGKPGEAGKDGTPGRDGLPGVPGRDGKDGAPGRDGLGIDDLEEIYEDEGRVLVRRYKRDGQVVKEFRHTMRSYIWRGIWTAERKYFPGDTVTFRGSTWMCDEECISAPPPEAVTGGEKAAGTASKYWTLAVKKGRDGQDGKKGEKGEPGKEGRAGRDLTSMTFDGEKYG